MPVRARAGTATIRGSSQTGFRDKPIANFV